MNMTCCMYLKSLPECQLHHSEGLSSPSRFGVSDTGDNLLKLK